MKTYEGKIKELPENGIFVFGSNTEGRHGAGAAKTAKDKFGAIYGQASLLQGKSYAIITKDLNRKIHPSVSVDKIKIQVLMLYLFAEQNKDLDFYIAYSGQGRNLNGYTPKEMTKMFFSKAFEIPDNIIFEEKFLELWQKES